MRRALPALLAVAALLWRCQENVNLQMPAGVPACDSQIAVGDPCTQEGAACDYVYRPCHEQLSGQRCQCGGFDNEAPNRWVCTRGDPKSSSLDCVGTCADLMYGKLACSPSNEGEACANPACFGHFCTCRDGGYECDYDAAGGCKCADNLLGRTCHEGWSCKQPPDCRCNCAAEVQATCDCVGGAWACDSGPEPDCDGGTDSPSDGTFDGGPG